MHRKTVFGDVGRWNPKGAPIRRGCFTPMIRQIERMIQIRGTRIFPASLPRASAYLVLPVLVALCLEIPPASAQMMLPGANNGVAVGAPPKTAGTPSEPAAVVHPIVVKPPTSESIIGHTLSRDGHSGTMVFDKAGEDVALTKLRFVGDKISAPQQSCSVDVSFVAPTVATPAGRPNGALRFDVPLEACPFTIDVLEGAVLVSRADPTCDFTAADCRVTPGGLWGPSAIDITPSKAAELERQRARIETIMRTNFRALIKKAGKDRVAVKAIARDQAAFSSQREMTCRDYDQEPVHGFCSTQITEARTLELLARFGLVEDQADRKRPMAAKKAAENAAASELRMTPAPSGPPLARAAPSAASPKASPPSPPASSPFATPPAATAPASK